MVIITKLLNILIHR